MRRFNAFWALSAAVLLVSCAPGGNKADLPSEAEITTTYRTWALSQVTTPAGVLRISSPGLPWAGSLSLSPEALRSQIEAAPLTVNALLTAAVAATQPLPFSTLDQLEGAVVGAERLWLAVAPWGRYADFEEAKRIDARGSLMHGLLEVHRKGLSFRPVAEVYAPEISALKKGLASFHEALSAMQARLARGLGVN